MHDGYLPVVATAGRLRRGTGSTTGIDDGSTAPPKRLTFGVRVRVRGEGEGEGEGLGLGLGSGVRVRVRG